MEIVAAQVGAEQGIRLAHPRAKKAVAAALGDRLGAESSRRLGDAVGKLHVVHKPLSPQLPAQALQHGPGGLLGAQGDAFAVDQGEAIAVAVEGDAQVGPFAIHGVAQFGQAALADTVRRPAVEIAFDRVVQDGEEALGKDGVQVTPDAARPCSRASGRGPRGTGPSRHRRTSPASGRHNRRTHRAREARSAGDRRRLRPLAAPPAPGRPPRPGPAADRRSSISSR